MSKHLSTSDISTLLTPTFAASKTITSVVAAASLVTVTATAHGYSTGDVIAQYGIGGAVEANGPFIITKVDADSYTLNGLTAVTSYTSGGSAKKITAGLTATLKPGDVGDLRDALRRISCVRGPDSDRSVESTIGSLLTTAG